MSQQCVVAVYDEFPQAVEAIQALEKSPFPNDQVSLATGSLSPDVMAEEALEYGDKTTGTTAKGAGIGGLVGLLLGVPLLLIPGIGPMLLAGPIFTGATGAVVGGFLGALKGWGVHEDHLLEYEQMVRNGKILVVAGGEPDDVAEAKRVLQETDTDRLKLHAATSADSPEITG